MIIITKIKESNIPCALNSCQVTYVVVCILIGNFISENMPNQCEEKINQPSKEGNVTEKHDNDKPFLGKANSEKPSFEGDSCSMILNTNNKALDCVNRQVSITRNSELYFRNVCRLQYSWYTCTIDSFLEIANVLS